MNKLIEVSVKTMSSINIILIILNDLSRYHLARNPTVGGIPAREAIRSKCL